MAFHSIISPFIINPSLPFRSQCHNAEEKFKFQCDYVVDKMAKKKKLFYWFNKNIPKKKAKRKNKGGRNYSIKIVVVVAQQRKKMRA